MPLPATRELLVTELKSTIARVMDIEESRIAGKTRFKEDLGMESLMALEIMVTLEKKYGVKLKEEELPRLSCLDAVVELMESKKGAA
jgi:acyl carrier protein